MFSCKKKTQKREKCKDISVAIKLCKNNKSRKCMPQKNSSRWPKTGGHVNIQPGFEFFFQILYGHPIFKGC